MSVHPRTDELVESILWSFETFVIPDLEDEYAVSVAHTIRNLLRLVALRIRLEGPALGDHVDELRALLGEVRDYAAGSEAVALQGVPASIDVDLAAAGSGLDHPGTVELSDEVVALRWTLDRALRALQAARPEVGHEPAYTALRAAVRAVLARQLEREAAWMDVAFSGRRR